MHHPIITRSGLRRILKIAVALEIVILQLPATVWADTPVRTLNESSWARIENVFILYETEIGLSRNCERLTSLSGDSWSDTGFNLDGVQPRPAIPLGNPPYPGTIATDGALWPVYLTTQFNSSVLQTFVFARSGSTVNGSIIPHGPDFVGQVQNDFLPRYGERNASSWQPYTSLFAMYFGINDINVALEMHEITTVIFDEIFASYSNLVDQV